MEPSKKYKLITTAEALRQMERHVFYLAKINPRAAKKLTKSLLDDMNAITNLPEKCPLYDRPWLIPGKYRYKLCAGRYRIVFVIIDNAVRIDGVMDCYEDDTFRQP